MPQEDTPVDKTIRQLLDDVTISDGERTRIFLEALTPHFSSVMEDVVSIIDVVEDNDTPLLMTIVAFMILMERAQTEFWKTLSPAMQLRMPEILELFHQVAVIWNERLEDLESEPRDPSKG